MKTSVRRNAGRGISLADSRLGHSPLEKGLRITVFATVILALGLASLSGCAAQTPSPSVEGPVTWDTAIAGLMDRHCVSCHGGSGGYYLNTYNNAFTTGNRAPNIIAGDSEGSRLVRVLWGTDPEVGRMPSGRNPLPDNDIEMVADWVAAGAPQSPTDLEIPATPAAIASSPTPTPLSNTSTPAAQPTDTPIPPTGTPEPTETPLPPSNTPETETTPEEGETSEVPGNATRGSEVWPSLTCRTCHGDQGQGASAPRLAGTRLPYAEVENVVRSGRGRMPAFNTSRVTEEDLRDLFAWLQELQP